MSCKYAFVLGEARAKKDESESAKGWSIVLFSAVDCPIMKVMKEDANGFMKEAHGDSVGFGKTSKPKIAQNGMPIKAETVRNEETGEDELTGFLTFTPKLKQVSANGIVSGGPKVIDSAQTPWPQNSLLGTGSIVRVKFHYYGWTYKGDVGISAELHAVQVIKHEPYEGRTGISADGFGVVEGGAIAPAEEQLNDGFGDQLREAAQACEADFGI